MVKRKILDWNVDGHCCYLAPFFVVEEGTEDQALVGLDENHATNMLPEKMVHILAPISQEIR